MKRFALAVVALAFVLMTTLAYAGEWTGQIVASQDGKLWFKAGEQSLSITNPEKAQGHEGQQVKVTGTADETAKTLTIESVAITS